MRTLKLGLGVMVGGCKLAVCLDSFDNTRADEHRTKSNMVISTFD